MKILGRYKFGIFDFVKLYFSFARLYIRKK